MSKVVTVSSEPHPLARFLDAEPDRVEAPEFIIDDVLTAGTVVVAGERGLGKTSFLVPLLLACTGLLQEYPLKASVRRKVVYVAEDTRQVRRIIAALRKAGHITVEKAELNDWFRLVEAKRLSAHQIARVVSEYTDLYTPNERQDGGTYLAPPVVVLDTTNAAIELANISDNAEVSAAVATLRQAFGNINLVLIGHVTKASRADAKLVSFIGAGSWEGDTQQTLYLVSDEGQRYLVLGKRRFEPDITEYRVDSVCKSFEATDVLGRPVEVACFFGIPVATSETEKAKAKERKAVEQKSGAWVAMQTKVMAFVTKNPGATTRAIRESVTGKAATIGCALDELVDAQKIRVEKPDGRTNQHYPASGTNGNQSRGLDG